MVHATGIVRSLPHILTAGETVKSTSLGAGNTGKAHDLETNFQIAEFKFIHWSGGSETVRQDGLLIDIFNLATAQTEKRRRMYLVGTAIPLHWLETSRRKTRACLERKAAVPSRFDEYYGSEAFPFVKDYWSEVKSLVEIVDLADFLLEFRASN